MHGKQWIQLCVILEAGQVERCLAVLIAGIHLGAVIEQQANHLYLSILRGAVQRGKAACLSGIYLRLMFQQRPGDLQVPACHRGMQRHDLLRVV